MAVLALLLLQLVPDPGSVAQVAQTLCAESSHNWTDAEAVAAVIVNRHRRRPHRSLGQIVTRPGQFATRCPSWRMRPRHYTISLRAHLGWLRPPPWLTEDVLFFCASYSRAMKIWPHRYLEAGRTSRTRRPGTMHVYWRLPRKG